MSLLVVALDEEELPVDGGKEVVHDDVHPGAILPELEVEDASVPLLVEALHSTSNILEERKSSVMEETSSMVAKRTLTWSLGTSSLKVWGTVAAPARAQRNQQSPSLRMMIMTMTLTVMVILPNLPWLTSSLLEPSTTNCASGNRMLARTHLISEASVGWRRKNQSPP